MNVTIEHSGSDVLRIYVLKLELVDPVAVQIQCVAEDGSKSFSVFQETRKLRCMNVYARF